MSCFLNYKTNALTDIKKKVLQNMINRAKIISTSHILFVYELSIINQTVINNNLLRHNAED